MDAARAKLYGRMHVSADVTDRGLEMRGMFETKRADVIACSAHGVRPPRPDR